ncbi:hypothetical protein PQR14_07970 [Paraburkholderia bryophila]|uniref:hypothetical protein n=1 Tax=Burkholderiaceae TaxID=119060 RepID=UPI0018CD585B|nr:hypothetical protein [Burkholderia sp. 9120]
MERIPSHRRPTYVQLMAGAVLGVALAFGPVPSAVAQTAAQTDTQSDAQTDQAVDARMDFLFGSHVPYRQFFDQLQQAVARADKPAVAGMVKYPITVALHGKKVTLRTKRDLVAHYDAIFTPKLVDLVAHQTYATLFSRDQGVMIGGGEIWFSGICRDKTCKDVSVKIITLNLDSLNG